MWANIAQKAAATEKEVVNEPRQRVVAVENAEDEENRDLENVHQNTIVDLPPYTKGCMVLDANAIIKGMDDFLSTADLFVTVPQVVAEVKDRAARELLDRLPYKLVVLDPTQGSLTKVMEMANKTGDFGVLSRTDLRLAAMAVDCAIATNSLKDEITPVAPTLNPSLAKASGVVEHDEEVDEDEVMKNALVEEEEKKDGDDDEDDKASVDSWDDPEAGEWITAENINQIRAAEGEVRFDGGYACATSDFPVQNVLLHVGVPVVGPRGMVIKQLRTWLLRCHACFALVHDTTRQFCSQCGSGDTLKRVSYTVTENGEKHLFINFKRHISTRGTVFNLPRPRGGKRGTNKTLALREDQLAHVIRGQANQKAKEKLVEADDELAVFGEVKRKKFDPNRPREQSSYKRYNVNERKKMLAGRRK